MARNAASVPLHLVTPEVARQRVDDCARRYSGPREPLVRVEEVRLPTTRTIPARVYCSSTRNQRPVAIYFHGGGWVTGGLDSHDCVARALAAQTGWLVISVGYRLAPEARFPAAVDECWAATEWLARESASLGGDPLRIALIGDSAGGNLAAVVAARASRVGVEIAPSSGSSPASSSRGCPAPPSETCLPVPHRESGDRTTWSDSSCREARSARRGPRVAERLTAW
jgi:acetyl esterase